MKKEPIWVIGMMSGTSFDGIDASLLQTDGTKICAFSENFFLPYPAQISQSLRKLTAPNHKFTISELLNLENEITKLHIQAVNLLKEQVLDKQGELPKIKLIGFHGQTIFHDPENQQTWQIGDSSLLAHATKIDVIANFRKNDILAGGKGAPLAPLYHETLMQNFSKPVAVINIGGISNITYFGTEKSQDCAFDIGPGNCLIDDFVHEKMGLNFDKNGEIARSGNANEALLKEWLKDPYFAAPTPKTLDRGYFSAKYDEKTNPKDFLASLTRFTAMSIANSMKLLPNEHPEICFLSGGGRKNLFLFELIQTELNKLGIQTKNIDEIIINDLKIDGDFVESQAFAFLAARSFFGLPTSNPHFTGSKFSCVGGNFYFAV